MNRMFSETPFNHSLNSWDVSSVTDMAYMFFRTPFNHSLNSWNVSSVTNMNHMFHNAAAFNGDISAWDVSSVTDMATMFHAAAFNGDISAWNVSSVTNMSSMFFLTPFTHSLNSWDVSSVKNMAGMFGFTLFFNGDISAWDVSSVKNMANMFDSADAFNGNISAWNVSSVENMANMFLLAPAFNHPLNAWNVSSVTSMIGMFNNAGAFDQNLGNWYVALDDASIDADDAPGMVGTISAQNQILAGHGPMYDIGDGGDMGSFNITGSSLNMTVSPDKSLYTVNITSTGDFGTGNHKILNIEVTGISNNTSPTLDAIGPRNVTELYQLSFIARATDADEGATLEFTLASGAPDGASINAATGEFSWTPTERQDGEYSITVVVADNYNATDSETITVTVYDVNSNPVLATIGNMNAIELVEFTFTADASDDDYVLGVQDSLSFALINTPPDGASINATTGEFSWTPTEMQDGEQPIYDRGDRQLNATNTVTTIDSEAFTVTVDEVNGPPELGTIGPKNATVSTALSFTATASDGDYSGGIADSLEFSLGSDDMTGASITSGGGFSWTPAATHVGEHTIRIQVTDGSNAIDYEDVTVTVTDSNTNFVVLPLEGSFVTVWNTTSANESITIPVNGATGNYTVNWGDGSITTHTGDAVHAYTAAGSYTVSISGNFTKIKLHPNFTNAEKLQSIERWGEISWTTMEGAFQGASNMGLQRHRRPRPLRRD